jgi:hypothetical protein
MKRKLMSYFSENRFAKGILKPFTNSAVRNVGIVAVIVLLACGPADTGDLTGVPGRRPWFHPQPPGTVYIPSTQVRPIRIFFNPTSNPTNK